MRPLHRHCRWLSGWLVALLLFMQWATAAYACPRFDAAPAAAEVPAMMADCSGDMPSMDPDQPQLCKAHCQGDAQSVSSPTLSLDAPPALALGAALLGVLDPADLAARAAAMPPASAAGPPVGTLALYLSLHVLRN